MKKFCFLPFFLTLAVLICTASGCEASYLKNEEKIYREKVEAFFDALDEGDATKIKSLFSETVIQNDTDIDEQIEKMISIYPRSETTVLFDELPCTEIVEKDEKGRSIYTPSTTISVVCNDEYYWVFLELIYIEGKAIETTAINRVYFYTADEYYIHFRSDDKKMPDDTGLLVFAEKESDSKIVCINSFPYKFTEVDREINISEIKDFLKSSNDFEEFTKKFGEPNATNEVSDYFYEIPETKEFSRYLCVQTQNQKIYQVSFVDCTGYYSDIIWKE